MISVPKINIKEPIIQISKSKYDDFCIKLRKEIPINANLDIFKIAATCDFIAQLSNDIFSEEVESIITLLNDINLGIVALDVPETSLLDKSSDVLFGVAAILGIFNKIGKSHIDATNATPFTLHTASHSSGKLLESTEYTPDAKLGFHNDGLLNLKNLEIPNHIVLYNLFINYRRPGKFRWIPSALWDDLEKYGKNVRSENTKIKIRLTPYFTLHKDGKLKKTAFDYIEVPVSNINENRQRRFFLNGKMLNEDNDLESVELIEEIRESLEKNPVKISIDQKERRAFFLKNTIGFHARDVFKDPIEDVDLTRVFLRSIDVNSEVYPSKLIKS